MELEDRSGNLWFSIDGYGVYRYDGKTFTRFTSEDGLCSNKITRILQDRRGDLWFACMQSYQPKMTGEGGVCRFDGRTLARFPDIKGLSENDIYTTTKRAIDDDSCTTSRNRHFPSLKFGGYFKPCVRSG